MAGVFLLVFCEPVFPQVKLETTVTSQYYCRADIDLDGLTLNLKAKYTNTGSQSVILTRDGHGIRQMIVNKNDRGAIGVREMNATFTLIPSSEWTARPSDLKRLFAILKPGESYTAKLVTRVFVFRKDRADIAGAVGNGAHLLQLRVSTWPGSTETEDQLEAAWKHLGDLWTNSVLSEPMAFNVVPQRRLVKCR